MTNIVKNETSIDNLITTKKSNLITKTTSNSPFLNNMKFLFYIANMINGISSVALYTIAISFIESMFNKNQVNLRQGIYYAIGAVGVGIGMLLTGNFLNLNRSIRHLIKWRHYLAVSHHNNVYINSNSVNWIGVSKFFFENYFYKFLFEHFNFSNNRLGG